MARVRKLGLVARGRPRALRGARGLRAHVPRRTARRPDRRQADDPGRGVPGPGGGGGDSGGRGGPGRASTSAPPRARRGPGGRLGLRVGGLPGGAPAPPDEGRAVRGGRDLERLRRGCDHRGVRGRRRVHPARRPRDQRLPVCGAAARGRGSRLGRPAARTPVRRAKLPRRIPGRLGVPDVGGGSTAAPARGARRGRGVLLDRSPGARDGLRGPVVPGPGSRLRDPVHILRDRGRRRRPDARLLQPPKAGRSGPRRRPLGRRGRAGARGARTPVARGDGRRLGAGRRGSGGLLVREGDVRVGVHPPGPARPGHEQPVHLPRCLRRRRGGRPRVPGEPPLRPRGRRDRRRCPGSGRRAGRGLAAVRRFSF